LIRFVGEKVEVQAWQDRILIFHHDMLIVSHPRCEGRYRHHIDKKKITELATCRFIANGDNVIFLGPPGVGKTHLAVALGIKAGSPKAIEPILLRPCPWWPLWLRPMQRTGLRTA
jgi:phosphate starvation-inducible protein PhoH